MKLALFPVRGSPSCRNWKCGNRKARWNATRSSRSLMITGFYSRFNVQEAIFILAELERDEFLIPMHIFSQTCIDSLKLAAQAPTSHHLVRTGSSNFLKVRAFSSRVWTNFHISFNSSISCQFCRLYAPCNSCITFNWYSPLSVPPSSNMLTTSFLSAVYILCRVHDHIR